MVTQTKQDAAWILSDAVGDKRFFCQDGRIINNLSELANGLAHMTQEVFRYHVTSGKNDFAIWVRDVLNDKILASELYNTSNPLEASKIVANKIAWLQRNRNESRRVKIKK